GRMDPIPRNALGHGGAEDLGFATRPGPAKDRAESNDPFLSQAHAEIHTPTRGKTPRGRSPETPPRCWDATLTAAELSKNRKPNRRPTPERPLQRSVTCFRC